MLQGESFELFSAAIRSSATRDPYERKLLSFLKRINMSPDDFMQFGRDNPLSSRKEDYLSSITSQGEDGRSEITAWHCNEPAKL